MIELPHLTGREEDVRDDDADRYRLYAVSETHKHRRLCETSRDGIGLALLTMLGLDPDGREGDGEAEIERGDRFGVFDRRTKLWIVNPWVGK